MWIYTGFNDAQVLEKHFTSKKYAYMYSVTCIKNYIGEIKISQC